MSLFKIVSSFTDAINKAKINGEFKNNDRMARFPNGCCDDACDLLAYYLNENFGIHTEQINGVYRDDNPNNTTNHVWLYTDEKIIIDITYKQFSFYTHSSEEIFVGKHNGLYDFLEDVRIQSNYNIESDPRLWYDYEKIKKYL